MKIDEVKHALSASVAGDLRAFELLVENSWADIVAARSQIEALLLEKAALRRAIEDWKEGAATTGQLQRWASFMRRGYVESCVSGAVSPIEITYDPAAEGTIVETISRLDELGDQIDGQLSEPEVTQILHQLA